MKALRYVTSSPCLKFRNIDPVRVVALYLFQSFSPFPVRSHCYHLYVLASIFSVKRFYQVV